MSVPETVLRRVLIANRGEIAVRILRTCARLGIETVLAASDADLDSVPARLADSTVRIGRRIDQASPAGSYLDVRAVVETALAARADAVHPGYGFLSENPRLARACGPRSGVHRANRGTAGGGPETSSPPGRTRGLPGPCCPAAGSRSGGRRTACGGARPAVLVKAVAGGACGWSPTQRRWPRRCGTRAPRRWPPSATLGCTSNGSSPVAGMSRCRSSATVVTPSSSASATARYSGATRSCSRKRPHRACRRACGRNCTRRPWRSPSTAHRGWARWVPARTGPGRLCPG